MRQVRLQPVVLSLDRQEGRYLDALGFYRYLRADQLTSLFYAPSSLTLVKTQLKILIEKGYVQIVLKRTATGKLVPIEPYRYSVAGPGMRYLTSLGHEPGRYFRPYKEAVRSESDLWHLEGVNDFSIALEILSRTDNRVRILERCHDLELRKNPCVFAFKVKNVLGQVVEKAGSYAPDLWYHVTLSRSQGLKPLHYNLLLEQDQATQGEKRIRHKVRSALLCFKSGAFKKRFSKHPVIITFVTSGGENRVSLIRSWIRRELISSHEPGYLANMFLCYARPQNLDPRMFFAPVWLQPFGKKQCVPLFNLS